MNFKLNYFSLSTVAAAIFIIGNVAVAAKTTQLRGGTTEDTTRHNSRGLDANVNMSRGGNPDYERVESFDGGIRASTSLVSMETKIGLDVPFVPTEYTAVESDDNDIKDPCEVTCGVRSVVQKYQCSDTTDTYVCYPTSGMVTDKVPVVLFQRGSSGFYGPDPTKYPDKAADHSLGYKSWMETIAKQCLVVIAPMTSGEYSYHVPPSARAKSCATDVDLITAYDDAQDNWWMWMGVDQQDTQPDWNQVGAGAHSAGAHHLPTFQMLFYQKYGKRINAVVFSHGGSLDDKTSSHYKPDMDNCLTNWKNATDSHGSVCAGIPAFFLTASGDTNTVPPERTRNWFMKLANHRFQRSDQQVVFAEVNSTNTGTDHMEPVTTGILNTYTARFLACHLYDQDTPRSKEACSSINDDPSSKGGLCSSSTTTDCVVVDCGEHCD